MSDAPTVEVLEKTKTLEACPTPISSTHSLDAVSSTVAHRTFLGLLSHICEHEATVAQLSQQKQQKFEAKPTSALTFLAYV